jgi:serine/threonine protein kinase
LGEYPNGRERRANLRPFHAHSDFGQRRNGNCLLAHDEELERSVALKFLPDLIIHDAAVLSNLKRETRRCLELTHKNIVRIYDFVHDERSGCISMEYIDGDTLRFALR